MGVKQWFLDRYIHWVVGRANARADKIRDLQEEAHRTEERIMRWEVFEYNIQWRNGQQATFVYTVRLLRDGRLEVLPNNIRPDLILYTDYPTVQGLATGRYEQVLPNGRVRVIEPFGAFDALRLGGIEYLGNASMLKELNLWEKRIGGDLMRELRLPTPSR
jgi:hypothetical protein